MPNPIRFALVLHNHQPVGNFDHVFEQAYQESYLPFLDVFERYDSLRITLHTSGPLMEWIDSHHRVYVDRLAKLVAQGRIEVIGGPFHEPILAMLPSRDRIGQIQSYTHWLEDRLGASIRGMWTPERVWEQSYTRDLVEAGMEYTVLDDFHFKNTGLLESQLAGHFTTEDDGRVMSIFPGSERLRYLIPFGSPEQTIEYLAQVAEQQPNAVMVFGDDGEKFGTWPGTHKHVYDDGWLARFFDALQANGEWLRVTTLAEAVDNVPPVGKIYLPDSSYREMTEWVLPATRLAEYDRLVREMADDPRWPGLRQFVRGGFWRNFKVKYREADEMYSRMLAVSSRLQQMVEAVERDEPIDEQFLEAARTELYRGQCNCAYWHGAFGGIYLPHLRNAVYACLIAADTLLDRAERKPQQWIDAVAGDFDFDARQEIRLANDKLVALVAPSRGGQLYELDVRAIRHNLLTTLARRPEAYHEKVLAGANADQDDCASIHDRVVFKQEGLERMLQYDIHPRKSLLDRFHDDDVSLEAIGSGEAAQHGDFVDGQYDARVRRNRDRIQVLLSHDGHVQDLPLRITKGLTLDAGSSTLEIVYLLEGLPPDRSFHFSVELNFAGLPDGAENRYFRDAAGHKIGQLGARLDLHQIEGLGLVDEWLGIDVGLTASCPTSFWTYPVQTVSQSEGGFEMVHQSVAVHPHWHVQGDAQGRWTVTLQLALDTSLAESRNNPHPATLTAT